MRFIFLDKHTTATATATKRVNNIISKLLLNEFRSYRSICLRLFCYHSLLLMHVGLQCEYNAQTSGRSTYLKAT